MRRSRFQPRQVCRFLSPEGCLRFRFCFPLLLSFRVALPLLFPLFRNCLQGNGVLRLGLLLEFVSSALGRLSLALQDIIVLDVGVGHACRHVARFLLNVEPRSKEDPPIVTNRLLSEMRMSITKRRSAKLRRDMYTQSDPKIILIRSPLVRLFSSLSKTSSWLGGAPKTRSRLDFGVHLAISITIFTNEYFSFFEKNATIVRWQ